MTSRVEVTSPEPGLWSIPARFHSGLTSFVPDILTKHKTDRRRGVEHKIYVADERIIGLGEEQRSFFVIFN